MPMRPIVDVKLNSAEHGGSVTFLVSKDKTATFSMRVNGEEKFFDVVCTMAEAEAFARAVLARIEEKR